MNYFDIFGITIRTELDFSVFLNRCDRRNYDYVVKYDQDFFTKDIFNQSEIICRKFIIGESIPYREVYKVEDQCYLIRWLQKYCFYIDSKKRILIINSELDGDFYAIFFSTVLSLLLYLKGYSQLHGSAVRYQDQTICFIGESGSGKSTCASLSVLNGGKIITDDIIALHPEGHMVKSGIPSLRLSSPDLFAKLEKKSMKEMDKFRVDVSNKFHYTKSSAINCFIFLEINNERELSFNRIKGSDTMLHLMRNVYNKDLLNNEFGRLFYEKNIAMFSYFSKRIPMFKIYRQSKTKSSQLFNLVQYLILKWG